MSDDLISRHHFPISYFECSFITRTLWSWSKDKLHKSLLSCYFTRRHGYILLMLHFGACNSFVGGLTLFGLQNSVYPKNIYIFSLKEILIYYSANLKIIVEAGIFRSLMHLRSNATLAVTRVWYYWGHKRYFSITFRRFRDLSESEMRHAWIIPFFFRKKTFLNFNSNWFTD